MIEFIFSRSEFASYRPNGESIVRIPEQGRILSIANVQMGDDYDEVMQRKPQLGTIKDRPAVILEKTCSTPYNDYELYLVWIEERSEWIAIWFCESIEGGMRDTTYTGPYEVNDDCCCKILESFGVLEAGIALEMVRNTSPDKLKKLATAK